MKKTRSSTIGYPRIGEKREWKEALEAFWSKSITEEDLLRKMEALRLNDLQKQKNLGIDLIPVGDFSFYDHVLDTAVMFGLIPRRFRSDETPLLQTYFDIARGNKEAVASEMTKWFNTNYHYIVPEFDQNTAPVLKENRPLTYFLEAKNKLGITGKPVLLGPVTLLKLSKGYKQEEFGPLLKTLVPLYQQVLKELDEAGAEWVQLDEPVLSTDLTKTEIGHVKDVYEQLHSPAANLKLLVQTYFESVSDYEAIISLPVDGIGLDFVHDDGANLDALKKYGFPADKTLAAGVVNGRNVWGSDLEEKWGLLEAIRGIVSDNRLIVQPSCSLLHVPVTVKTEDHLEPELKGALAFADQKIDEITLLTKGINEGRPSIEDEIKTREETLQIFRQSPSRTKPHVQNEVSEWEGKEPARDFSFTARQALHQDIFKLPVLPTTTIGSLPQTTEIRQARSRYRHGEWSTAAYDAFIQKKVAEWIEVQEWIGLDVLVHGEFERNDMVEYFGEKLDGFAFTKYGWVQSYGSRSVKPPIIYGDVALPEPMTTKDITYAQSLTDKPVKGMLTGPVTIYKWSFPREDIRAFEVTKQLALALQNEISHLEKNGIGMIQVDEPALREGLPLKDAKKQQYLQEAIYAFKLATCTVKKETQVHTHMCYSEFGEIIDSIKQLDADVISIETARSHGELIADFEKASYDKGIGLGVYDIHSPRVPSTEEMETSIRRALQVLHPQQFWVNPDCGLKTRGIDETVPSLKNMVEATQRVREALGSVGAVPVTTRILSNP
ncbi:5-methyltetrahydropteroyltriglutamate--homocysteine S-methyltransferase [Bacillus sp. H-16]|uniref:5-methyltetrahydropteroyltriglutamate-- homocysteine S-methyltransferase n=1 Tax=Alteribacter salitolerans TaxID=2912333 RepID=UPI001965446A|nr:5-methyltetrahydropteroyltriglutamate--homocysteine S-methyltransferase [Alteribacter salitolerans]MBM7094820.1 5-methyltetrahydropteroyltriglutamate--homocysteine S-methyltransferase [Alteribacter salitolerans]